MAGYANNMTNLLNKIEMRLGTKPLNLPKDISKDKWADVIINDTLVTFSRYYPHAFKYHLGDFGTQFGYVIEGYKRFGAAPYVKPSMKNSVFDLNEYITKAEKLENQYLVYLKDIILDSNSNDYIVININNNKINIDYTVLMKNFDETIEKYFVNI